MASLEKIKLGKKDKRAFFNMSHQVNSTLSVGFAEPTMCLDVVPNAKVDIQAYTGVRLAPLPQPTTGKLKMKQYYSYVKTKDVFEAFDHLQSQTAVASSRGSYIPTHCDSLPNHSLFAMLLVQTAQRFASALDETGKLTSRDIAGQFFRLSFNTDLKVYGDTSMGDSKVSVHNIFDELLNVFKTTGDSSDWYYMYQAVNRNITENLEVIARQLSTALGLSSYSAQPWDFSSWLNKYLFYQYDGGVSAYIDGKFPEPSTSAYADYYKYCQKIAPADTFTFSKALGFDNADYYIEIPVDGLSLYRGDGDQVYSVATAPFHVYLGIHLTQAGKRLFKVLNTLFGGNFRYSYELELPKIYAYYKAYFDIFNPGRNIQWKDTNCYRLIHSFYDSPVFCQKFASEYFFAGGQLVEGSVIDADFCKSVSDFYVDIAQCFYTEKIDPITVATESPVLNTGPDGSYSNGGSNTLDSMSLYTNLGANDQTIDDGYGSNSDLDGALNIRFLQSLYNWVNKNSVIGQRVAQYMAEHFGVNVPRTSFIDKDSFDIDIFDSVATVNNEETSLGEYAGLGKGRATGQTHKFDAPEHGYIFQMSIIVPVGGYVQTSPVNKIRRFDWYQPQFDSVGMEPMGMSEVFDRCSWLNKSVNYNPTFGFRPRYFSQKYKNNLANGGFAFRSEKSLSSE